MGDQDRGWLLPAMVDPPRRAFCITIPNEPFHVAAFFGTLQTLAEWWNWQRDAEHTATMVAQVWRSGVNSAHVAFYDEECQMYLLRQNPTELCQLQQSIDGGDTWTLAFDFALCIPPAIETIVNRVDALYSNNWTPSPYAPLDTWVHTDGDSVAKSDQRAAALCYASQQVVGLICDTLVSAYQGAYTLATIAQIATALLAPYAVILGGPVFAGIIVAILEIALATVQQMIAADIAILQDEDIRALLACVLFQQMSSRPVTEFSLASAFDDDFTCLTADQERALELMNLVLSNQDALADYFKGFSDIVAQSLIAENAGLLPTCACPTSTWEYCIPLDKWFERSESALPIVYNCSGGTSSEADGSHLEEISSVPVWASGASGGFLTLSRKFHIYVPSNTTITSIGFSRDWWQGSEPNEDGWAKTIRVNATCVGFTSFAPAYITASGLTLSAVDVQIEVVMVNSGGTTNVLAVNAIKFTGTGVPLFGGCVTCP